jgi:glutamate synthase (NADPH/NADH) small chain
VTVFEKSDRIGGLLRYGIPEFKMEKRFLDRRLAVMEAEGVVFRAGVNVGVDVPADRLVSDYDAVLLAGGAEKPRDLQVPGRELAGIHFAMEYLTLQNRRNEGDKVPDEKFISARDRHVVIIGGGDTGADCLGTAHRQGARSIYQLELMDRPPDARAEDNPWPLWPQIFRVSSAHEEGGERLYAVSTQRFSGDEHGRVRVLHAVKVEVVKQDGRMQFVPVAGSEFEIPADLVLLAMGFVGPEKIGLLDGLGVKLTDRGNVARDAQWMTSVPGVFSAGDMQRGQSLIVWAIAEGRSAARAIDKYLMGESQLPAPLA